MVRKFSYSQNSSKDATGVEIGNVELFFSYETVVAFRVDGDLKVCENVWGTTTGKHLNWIDGGDKKSRLCKEDFKKELNKLLEEKGWC